MTVDYKGSNFTAKCLIEDGCLTFVEIISYDGVLTDEVKKQLINEVSDNEDSILGFKHGI